MSINGTRAHGSLTRPSSEEVLAALHAIRPRRVPQGAGTIVLPGVTVVDIARHLGASEEWVRPLLGAHVLAGRVTAALARPYVCYRLTGGAHG